MSGATPALAAAAFRVGWSAVRRLPTRAAYRLFDAMADQAFRRDGKSVRRLRANYAMVRPELAEGALEELVRAGMRSYFRYWCEAFRLPDRSVADLVAQVRVVGDEPVRAELSAGRGVACFMAHLGNWDTAGAWSTTQLSPVTTVAERLEPERLFADFLSFRERLGMRIIPLTGGSGSVFGQLQQAARDGALVPLLADRDLTDSGLDVTFCGHPARMAAGPAALAVTTGAALFPVSVLYQPVPRETHVSGYRLVITFHDRVPDPGQSLEAAGTVMPTGSERIAAMTQVCADVLGEVVRERTEDWHMMQRVFLRTRDPARDGAPLRRSG